MRWDTLPSSAFTFSVLQSVSVTLPHPSSTYFSFRGERMLATSCEKWIATFSWILFLLLFNARYYWRCWAILKPFPRFLFLSLSVMLCSQQQSITPLECSRRFCMSDCICCVCALRAVKEWHATIWPTAGQASLWWWRTATRNTTSTSPVTALTASMWCLHVAVWRPLTASHLCTGVTSLLHTGTFYLIFWRK